MKKLKHLKVFEELAFKDEENIEVNPDDFVISSSGFKYTVSSEDHGFVGEYVEMDDAVKALQKWMDSYDWYPDVWLQSDHGNLSGPHSIDELVAEYND